MKREVATDVVATLVAIGLAVLLARIAAELLHIDIGWRLHVTTIAVTGICAPIIILPLAHANRRLAEMKRKLERLAHTDPLTGLPNRRAFFERANEMFAARQDDRPSAVVMIDIDRFKLINDTYGHDAGDAVLRTVGDAISVAAGSGSDACAGRIGGEEFAIVVAGVDSKGIAALAERVCKQVRGAVCEHRGTPISVTVSVGAALRVGTEPVDAVLKAADVAVYEAKNRGRDRWSISNRSAVVADFDTFAVRARARAA